MCTERFFKSAPEGNIYLNLQLHISKNKSRKLIYTERYFKKN